MTQCCEPLCAEYKENSVRIAKTLCKGTPITAYKFYTMAHSDTEADIHV